MLLNYAIKRILSKNITFFHKVKLQITAAATGAGAGNNETAGKDGESPGETARADGGRKEAAIRQAARALFTITKTMKI